MKLLLALSALLLAACSTTPKAPPLIAEPPIKENPPKLEQQMLWGATFESVSDVKGIVKAMAAMPKPSAARLVFQPGMKPSEYKAAIDALLPVSTVVAMPFDSTAIRDASLADTKKKWADFMAAFPDKRIVWEVGNEQNGEWAGDPQDVADKVIAGYRAAKALGKTTMLTPIINFDGKNNCWKYKTEEMWAWLDKYLPADVQPDYVLISFYEHDCPGVKPDWLATFTRLSKRFPNAKVGFGEVGTPDNDDTPRYAAKYYSMRFPSLPNYIGGWFWWYGNEDLVGEDELLEVIRRTALKASL